jgi:hypothetical protein
VDQAQGGLAATNGRDSRTSLEHHLAEDIVALTREAADVTGISYVMDAYRDEAELSSTANV